MMLTFVALFIFASANLINAAESPQKIGTFSLQTVLSQSRVGQEANKTIEDEIAKYMPDLQQQEAELNALEEDIKKKSSVWSEEVRNEKVLSFQQKNSEFDLKKKFAEKKVQQVQKKTMEPILKTLHEIIEEVAKKQGVAVVFEKSMPGLLYADDALDINDIVIKELDARSSK